MIKRIFLIVLDSLGIGALPDCLDFGDENPNTLKSISNSKNFSIPNLINLGIGNIQGLDYLEKKTLKSAVGRLKERSMGKDTTIGHWEISGIVSKKPLPVFSDGFPKKFIDMFSEKIGRGVICNKPYSGTEVIKDYGEEHIKTGKLIVYTSADSVFQIAAHKDIVPIDELYKICEVAREMLTGDYGVGRVIARPFEGEYPFKRTDRRRDFSLEPQGETMLDAIKMCGKECIAVGKISDIFAERGITKSIKTHGNLDGILKTIDLIKTNFEGLAFINLVDFDMLYGHRNDIDGYAAALSDFDSKLPEILENLRKDDVMIITADHGCDPGDISTDHTREYIPILVLGQNVVSKNIGTRESFCDIAASVCEMLNVHFDCEGSSFKGEIIND